MTEDERTWAKDNKRYFKLVVVEDDYFFQSKTGDVLRFAGGGMGKRKFIQTALIDTYGEKEGVDVFNKFLNAIENIKKTSQFGEDTAVFVLYPNTNAPTIKGSSAPKKV